MADEEPLVFLPAYRVPQCEARFDRRVLGFHLQLTQGRLDLAYDDLDHALEGDWAWSTEPGPRVRFAPTDRPWFHRHVGFMGGRVAAWERRGLWPVPPQRIEGGAGLAAEFDALIDLARRADPWTRERATLCLESLLVELAELRGAPPPDEPWLARVVRTLDAESFGPDYAGLAARMGRSESALRRRFRRESGGLALHEYVVQSRVGRAKSLLETIDLPLAGIAEACGYGTEAFFARQFRRHAGTSPGSHRRSTRGSVGDARPVSS